MRIERAICPYISEDEEDFEKHFMNKHSPVEKSLIRYVVEYKRKYRDWQQEYKIYLRLRTWH